MELPSQGAIEALRGIGGAPSKELQHALEVMLLLLDLEVRCGLCWRPAARTLSCFPRSAAAALSRRHSPAPVSTPALLLAQRGDLDAANIQLLDDVFPLDKYASSPDVVRAHVAARTEVMTCCWGGLREGRGLPGLGLRRVTWFPMHKSRPPGLRQAAARRASRLA